MTFARLGRSAVGAGLLVSGALAHAGYEAGHDAYQRRDFPRALAEFVPAASSDSRAALALSGMFERGEGVPRDPHQALMWLRQAGELGGAATQFEVGQAYARGTLVAADPREAAHWYRRAAERGHVDAQYALGRQYADGDGMAPDPIEARRWIERAAQGGHPQARAWLGWAPMQPPATRPPSVPDTPPQAQTPPAAGDPHAEVEPTRPRRPQTTWYYGFSYGYGWGPYWGWYDPFWGPPRPYAGWGWGYPRYGCCPGGGAQFGVIIRP